MAATIGEMIKAARSRLGWDQAKLADLLGIGQQSVSRWERGLSTPKRAAVKQLADVLELDAGELLQAAAAGRTGEVTLPVQPRSLLLPLNELAPDAFERFSADLAQALYPDATVHRYGGQGHTQGGIDVEIQHANGTVTGLQCKREKNFGPAKIDEAVAALTASVDECHIYLTRVASPQARKAIARHATWKLRDIDDLSRTVQLLPNRDIALRIVDTYFPGWREPFLGIPAPGPWLTPSEFFRATSGDRVYTHEWPLVGRANQLRDLQAFVAAPTDAAIALLVGRGGIGKSRVLRALAAAVEAAQLATVRFLAAGAEVTPGQFELLPPNDRLLVVVDDAHSYGNAALIGGIRRVRPKATIVLSLRPQGLGQLAAELRQVGVHPSELPQWTLDDLESGEAESLALEVLGTGGSRAVAQRLATIAPDCPLLIVVGATLIRRGQLDPRLLESSDSIRTEILSRFRDVIVPDATGGGVELRREALKAVAALQPFRIEKPEFQDAIARLAGSAFDQVMLHLQNLEGAGVLLRQGSSFRVVPDLLGDVVLADAAVDGLSGVSLGYLERAFRAGTGEALQHLFVNASRVDWQIRQDGRSATLIDQLWNRLVADFEASGIYGRLTLLKLVEKVAFYQPDRTLTLIRWAVANPTDTVEETDHPLSGLFRTGYRTVLDEIPVVLENVGYNLDHLPAVADVLWDLARHDTRPLNQYPNHPIRILTDLAAYDVGKPAAFQEILTDAVQRWLARGDLTDWPYSPFEIVKPLLATEFETRHFDGRSVILSARAVRPEAVAVVRSRILDLAFAEVTSTSPKRAVQAVQAIAESISYPHGMFGRMVSSDERDRWTPSFVDTIERLGHLTADEALDPAVAMAIEQVLRRHALHSSTATKAAAQDALAKSVASLDRRLADVLHDGWGHDVEYTGDIVEFDRRRQARLDDVATAVTAQWSDEELVDRLSERLTANRTAYGSNAGQPGPFLWTLARRSPTLAEIVCQRVVDDPASILRDQVSDIIGCLALTRPNAAVERARQLLATNDLVLQRAVAHGFGWGRGNRDGLIDGEAELLKSLVRHDDRIVRRLAVTAARGLSRSQHALALELVTTTRFADAPDVAEEIAGLFSTGGLSWTDLSASHAEEFLQQLRACQSIDSYTIITLLGTISRTRPDAVVDLLKGRVERYMQERELVDYRPLPHLWHKGLRVRESDGFIDTLRSVVGWIADDVDSAIRRREGAEIFAAVANGFDEQVLAILTEAIDSGDARQIKAVGSILRAAPRTLVWDEQPFVIGALRTSERHGDQLVKAIAEGLHAAVVSGGRSGALGEPFPEDIEQRDKSIAAAEKLSRGSIEQRFYQSLAKSAESRIRWEVEHDRISTDGRDW